jgi:hypothetical protein
MLTSVVPELETATLWLALVPIVKLPKFMLDGFATNCPLAWGLLVAFEVDDPFVPQPRPKAAKTSTNTKAEV